MPIHPNLNPNSLKLGDFGFGSFNFSVPPNQSTYSQRLDVKDSLGVFVDVTAGLDIPNRRAFWIFESIDPNTGLSATLPANSGFLPINDSITHKGEGYVMFSLQPNTNVVTGDTVAAKATIFFDAEDSVQTNTWVNTIDAKAPVSSVSILPNLSFPNFPILWTGKDDTLGSGIKNYDIYYSKNNGPFSLLSNELIGNSLQFTGGDIGATYSFYSIATDNAGNRENSKSNEEQSTIVKPLTDTVCPAQTTSITSNNYGTDYSYQWQVNSGSGFTNISDNTLYSNTTTNTLTIKNPPSGMYGYLYRCIANNNVDTKTGLSWILRFANKWTGAIDAAWEKPGNWSCNKIPDDNTDVIINPTVNRPVVSSSAVCRSLNLSNGVTFTIKANYKLDIKARPGQ